MKHPHYGPPSYARPLPPSPMTAEDALLQAVYWLRFGNTPENALPWLTYAGRYGRTKEDFDELAKYDAEVERRAPSKWREYQKGRLKIQMRTHPRSLSSNRDPSARKALVESDARAIADAYARFGAKDAQELFANIVRQKRLTLAEQVVLKDKALKLIPKPASTKAPRKKVSKTFLQARQEILDELAHSGWSLSLRTLKVPHATSPSGRLRLWFKPQAVWFSRGGHHELGRAHTVAYDLDIREMSARSFVEWILRQFPEAS